MRWVRCSSEFQMQVMQRTFPERGAMREAANTLSQLFISILPLAQRALRQADTYTPLRILAMNDYVMEKAFVWGVIAFSKWLTPEHFPQGVYEWPPAQPPSAAAMIRSEPVRVIDDVPAHVRGVGFPAMGSGGSL